MVQKLGVVTPVYNRPRYFRDTAGSVLAQSYKDFLWVIVDDGSTDPEIRPLVNKIIREAKIRDIEVHAIRRDRQVGDNKTPSNAINRGFNRLYDYGCQYFAYVHSDDLLTEDSLEARVKGMGEGIDMIYSKIGYLTYGAVFVNDNAPYYRADCTPSVLEMDFPHHTSMWSRRMLELMRGGRNNEMFDKTLTGCEDLDVTLYCRRLLSDHPELKLGYIDGLLYVHVKNDESISATETHKRRINEISLAYRKNGFEAPNEDLRFSRLKRIIRTPFFWIPERIKRPLLPLRELVRKTTNGKIFPSIPLKINPYWFKEKSDFTSP